LTLAVSGMLKRVDFRLIENALDSSQNRRDLPIEMMFTFRKTALLVLVSAAYSGDKT
jgi:hypothetical protein